MHTQATLPLRYKWSVPVSLGVKIDTIPSTKIHGNWAWEGTSEMLEVSPYDLIHRKDLGVGVDNIWESMSKSNLGHKCNMLTRLIFDECLMSVSMNLNLKYVIKMLVNAKGHKDLAMAICSPPKHVTGNS